MLLENDFITLVCVFTADVFTVAIISYLRRHFYHGRFFPGGCFHFGHIFPVVIFTVAIISYLRGHFTMDVFFLVDVFTLDIFSQWLFLPWAFFLWQFFP